MKKQNYTAPEIIVVDLAEKVNTALAEASGQEGTAVMLSWLIGE